MTGQGGVTKLTVTDNARDREQTHCRVGEVWGRNIQDYTFNFFYLFTTINVNDNDDDDNIHLWYDKIDVTGTVVYYY